MRADCRRHNVVAKLAPEWLDDPLTVAAAPPSIALSPHQSVNANAALCRRLNYVLAYSPLHCHLWHTGSTFVGFADLCGSVIRCCTSPRAIARSHTDVLSYAWRRELSQC